MSLPLIGSNKEKRDKENDIKYQQEMRRKLVEWEIENKCLVLAILTQPKGDDYYTFHSMLNFKVLDENQTKEYKNLIDEDNAKLIQNAEGNKN